MDVSWGAEAAGGNGGPDGYWRLVLMLAAIGILGLFARWRKSRQPPPIQARELRERDRDPNRYRDSADRALVELVEMGREINAQVDNKIRFLNRLVKDADKRIAELERLLRQAGSDAGNRPAASVTLAGADAGAPETAAADESVSASRRFRSALQARVVTMKGEGGSVSEIAAATGLSILEIQLALKNAGIPPGRPSRDGDDI